MVGQQDSWSVKLINKILFSHISESKFECKDKQCREQLQL